MSVPANQTRNAITTPAMCGGFSFSESGAVSMVSMGRYYDVVFIVFFAILVSPQQQR